MILVSPLRERLFHWAQALCTIVLIITGAMMHWPEQFPGYFQWAVWVHNRFGIAAVGVFALWLAYNVSTGRISHYVPKKTDITGGMFRQMRYYVWGIFYHEPLPHRPTEDEKFNPLQRMAYLHFQLFFLPIVLLSGLLYMYPYTFRTIIEKIGGMALLGSVHFVFGGLFGAFLVAHVYLASTGETLGEYFRLMITGFVGKPKSAVPEAAGTPEPVAPSEAESEETPLGRNR
jgi:thiosulfate reductase cytochrome b subunit